MVIDALGLCITSVLKDGKHMPGCMVIALRELTHCSMRLPVYWASGIMKDKRLKTVWANVHTWE